MEETPKKVIFSISTSSVIKTLLILFGVFMIIYLIDVVLIVLTAIVIASAVEPVIKWFVKRKLPRVLSTFIVYAFLIALIAGLFYYIMPTMLVSFSNFVVLLPKTITALNIKTSGLGSEFFNFQKAVSTLSPTESLGTAVQNITTALATASQSALATLTTIFGGVVSFVLVVVLSFYFAVREGNIEDFLRLITPLHKEEYSVNLWRRTQNKIARWIQGQLILALIIGVLVYIGLRILGVPNPLFLAFISTVFEIIPVFGPFIGSVPGVLIAFSQGGLTYGLVVALMYLIVQQIESNVIYPLVVQKVLDVPPLVVMIALVVGAKLGGFLGILLSVPLAAALMEYLNDVGKNRIIARAKMSGENL